MRTAGEGLLGGAAGVGAPATALFRSFDAYAARATREAVGDFLRGRLVPTSSLLAEP